MKKVVLLACLILVFSCKKETQEAFGQPNLTEVSQTPEQLGKSIFEEMYSSGDSPDEIIESQGLRQISDDGAIEEIISTVIKENPSQVEAYLGGKEKLFGFFFFLLNNLGVSTPTYFC